MSSPLASPSNTRWRSTAGWISAHRMLGVLADNAGEHDAAIDHYRATLAVAPNDAIAANNLAYDLSAYANRPAEALPFAQRAYRLNPSSASVVDTLGWIQHVLAHDAEAFRLYATILASPATGPEIHLHAAVVLAAVGRQADAARELDKALAMSPALAENEEAIKLRGSVGAAR